MMNRVIDSIEELDLDWHLDAANLIEEYTDLDDDSAAQDAAMYLYAGEVGLFEIFIATYLYCVDYHEGQYSEEYEVLSQLKAAGLQVQGSIDDQDESIQDLFEKMVAIHHS
tara:strand:+ start:58 stop:390 length:333 start_codon:yes stop_codon:yes gene_type:complete